MKKSLLITFYFPPVKGGISNSLWNICQCLPSNKIVVLTEPSKIEPKASFTILRKKLIVKSKMIWPKWIFMIRTVKKIILSEKIDNIQAGQILPIGTICLILKKIYRIPYMVYVYGQDLRIMRDSWRKMWLIRLILKNADIIIANSKYTKETAVRSGAKADKTIVIYPSPIGMIDTNIDQQYSDYISAKYSFINKKIILTVGNIVERKGQDMIIEALPEIIKKIPDVLYVIVGTGEYEKKISKKIKQLNLKNYVKIFKNVTDDELPYFYHASTVFAMISRKVKNTYDKTIDFEGFGIVFLEANLFGKPVIGGNTGGVPEAIANNVSGLLADPTNVHEIADILIKVLKNPELCKKLGEQGRERALSQFQCRTEVEKIKNALK